MTVPPPLSSRDRAIASVRGLLERLTPRQRQYALLAAILAGGVGLLWLIFTFTGSSQKPSASRAADQSGEVTNIGVMPPGGQVNAEDQWVGTAGRKLAQYESEREEQRRVNKDRQDFETRTMQRFSQIKQRLTADQQARAASAAAPASLAASAPAVPATAPPAMPPVAGLPPPSLSTSPAGALPAGLPPPVPPVPPVAPAPIIARVTLAEPARPSASAPTADGGKTVATFLPVSFTRGTLLGGLDAPTGGQAQSNPQPVLIRLSDNSVLPNRFRGEYRDCFVIAAGYGDISSERAYLRTENLSCVRVDGATLEVRIQGTVYGEDGKVGMRGRLV